jgi:hypothetical protein
MTHIKIFSSFVSNKVNAKGVYMVALRFFLSPSHLYRTDVCLKRYETETAVKLFI